MSITVDRLNASVIATNDKVNKNTLRHPRKRWYNRKTPRAAKIIKTMINFMYYEKKQEQEIFFVTITTCQHKSGMSDKELYARIRLWFKNRKQSDYVIVLERQKDTQDIHYHCVILFDKGERYSFRRELEYLGKLLRVQPHPALLDVKRVFDIKTVVGYINKYVTKENGKYCSLFTCRTFSVSKRLRRRYKELADKYVVRVDPRRTIEFIIEAKSLGLWHLLNGVDPATGELVGFYNNFFASFKYSTDIWQLVQKYQRGKAETLESK